MLVIMLLGSSADAEEIKPALNIILISVDTLRADHLSCYGYHRKTSPNIDKFAREGVLFRNAVSQSTATLPSHTSIFTSRYPSQHKSIKRGSVARPVEDSEITLAEILRDNGYITAAFTDGGEMSAVFNMGQGFDLYSEESGGASEGGIEKINKKVFRWLEENKNETFFLFVHCYDTHAPYMPPSPFSVLYIAGIEKDFYKQTHLMRRKTLSDKQVQDMIALYDGEIAYTDKNIGEFFQKIDELGLTQKSLIIFTSDHGEEFKEHGGLYHNATVYDEVIMVPLIFKNKLLPGGAEIKEQVRSIDIAPTVLDILGIPAPKKMMGKSLLGLTAGKDEPERIAFSENEKRTLLSCRSLEYKLIVCRNASPSGRLFNLKDDRLEKNPLIDDTRLSPYNRLEKEIISWQDIIKETAQDDKPIHKIDSLSVPDDVKEKLRSLGYTQ